uniref:Large ribosomal subunit protein mL43 n=1 Tax=Myxobolus squamalis TaxID=59785 RepID=A0A6B2G5T1_MYXSQ
MASYSAGKLLALNYRFNIYVPQLKRLILCYNNLRTPEGVKSYIDKELRNFTKKNPGTAFYTLSVKGGNFIIAQYLNNFEKEICIAKMTCSEISNTMEYLSSNSGSDWKNNRMRKLSYSSKPSTQGVWSNNIHKNTNVIHNS